MSQREHQLQRRALLTPTPLWWIDRDGEAERLDALDRAFDLGPAPNAEEQARLDRASNDADDALLGGLSIEPPAWRMRARGERLRHPLSGSALATPSRDQALSAWARWMDNARELVARLRAHNVEGQPRDRKRLDALWWAVVDEGGEPSTGAARDLEHASPWMRLPAHPALPDVPAWSRRSLSLALFAARSPEATEGAHDDTGEAALVHLHIGPVKRFIEAARRTHDLWLGSYLLAHLGCRMVEAVAVACGPAAVIYPFVGRLPLLRRVLTGEALAGDDRLDLLRAVNPNKLLALVPAARADAIAARAAQAAYGAWTDFGRQALDELQHATRDGVPGAQRDGRPRLEHDALWSDVDLDDFAERIERHLEFGAWVQPWPADRAAMSEVLRAAGADAAELQLPPPLPDQAHERVGAGYGLLFNAMHRSLGAARQADVPAAAPGDQRPKCTQCGVNEQVGPTKNCRGFWRAFTAAYDRPLQFRPGEGLCSVCLVKRVAPRHVLSVDGDLGSIAADPARLGLRWDCVNGTRPLLRFPSVSSIATAPFRHRLNAESEGRFGEAWEGAINTLNEERKLTNEEREFTNKKREFTNKERGFTCPGNQISGLGDLGRGNPLLNPDGEWLYPDRYDTTLLCRQWDIPWSKAFDEDVHRAKGELGKIVEQRWPNQAAPKPSKYFAVVKMDGDDFGQWITGRAARRPALTEVTPTWVHDLAEAQLEVAEDADDEAARDYWSRWLGRGGHEGLRRPLSPALHGELSRRLAVAGTSIVPQIVEEHGLGRVIYSGGDDMLAFLPVETVLPTVAALVDRLRRPDALHDRVTFSGGIAIGHVRTPLSRTVERAGKGEDHAKRARKRFIRLAEAALARITDQIDSARRSGVEPPAPLLDRRSHFEALLDDLRRTGWLYIELHPGSGSPLQVVLPRWLPPRRSNEKALDLVGLIQRMLTTYDRGARVFSDAPAHKVAAEAHLLAGQPEALVTRVRSIARRSAIEQSERGDPPRARDGVDRVVDELARVIRVLGELVDLHPPPPTDRPELDGRLTDLAAPHHALVGLLLLVRFLDREVPADTGEFVEELERGARAPTGRSTPEEER